MNYDEALEVMEQAHTHSMDEISKAGKIVDGMKIKAEMWDTLKAKLKGKNKHILSKREISNEEMEFVGNNKAVIWKMEEMEKEMKNNG